MVWGTTALQSCRRFEEHLCVNPRSDQFHWQVWGLGWCEAGITNHSFRQIEKLILFLKMKGFNETDNH